MSVKDYLALFRDSGTMIKTLRQTYGKPKPPKVPHYAPRQARTATDRVHPDRVPVRVGEVRRETASTVTLVVEPLSGRLPPALPGQYVNVFIEVAGVQTSRPMSISSFSGAGDRMELTVKRKPGGFVSVHLVDQVKPGDRLTLSGPEGDFHYSPVRDGCDLVLIAGGSGIAPFMGMVEETLERHPDLQMALLYASQSPDDIIFRERLEALAAVRPRFSLGLVVERPGEDWSGERGRVDGEMIRRFLQGEAMDGKTFFVSGPRAMEHVVRAELQALGVSLGRMRFEPSGPMDDPTRLPDWPPGLDPQRSFQVEIEGRQHAISASAGEPLVNALERAGVTVPVLCRSGSCGTCRTKLRSGTVVRPDEPGQRLSDRTGGVIHTCICYPVSDLKIQTSGVQNGVSDSPKDPPTQEPPTTKERLGPQWLLGLVCLGMLVYFTLF